MTIREIRTSDFDQECVKCGAVRAVTCSSVEVGVARDNRIDSRIVPLPPCPTCGATEFLLHSPTGEEHPTPGSYSHLHRVLVDELQAKFAEVTGETTRSPNKTFLIRRITEALEADDAKTAKANEPEADVEATAQTEPAPAREKLTKLDVPTLQARYLEVVGRPTGSDNKAYLIWKIREAQKGRIPVGPRKSAHREGVTF